MHLQNSAFRLNNFSFSSIRAEASLIIDFLLHRLEKKLSFNKTSARKKWSFLQVKYVYKRSLGR